MITQKSHGFADEQYKFFGENPEISSNESEYLRNLVYEDIRKRNQFQFLPSVEAKETDFVDLDQVYPFYKSIPIFAPEGFFQTNKLLPDFSKLL